MFWKKTIEEIHNWQGTFEKIMVKEIEKVNELIKSNETYKKCIEEIKKQEEAIAAIISSDRKDINAIINIIKKLQTKGKK